LLNRYIQPLLDAKADVIVLGCTHYPFLRAQIQSIVGKEVALIDTGDAVAKQLKKRLQEAGLLNLGQGNSNITFYSNSHALDAKRIISSLWHQPETDWRFVHEK
jgi:glutamate racemase